ncbi:hypothetical protein J1N35_014862 [Gossypium stocksii]|uniref:Uncharacterized protein n=1 Tax=Gossypium stocksii TaxID=47602 RepID=A0A9D4AA63_9ROSI|nr:hypothetical protein J1N35_014862 [Gossypium stocksii]
MATKTLDDKKSKEEDVKDKENEEGSKEVLEKQMEVEEKENEEEEKREEEEEEKSEDEGTKKVKGPVAPSSDRPTRERKVVEMYSAPSVARSSSSKTLSIEKIHESRALSVKCLKSLGDEFIKDQHFTIRDFVEAVLNFEIGISNVAFIFLEEFFIQFKGVAKVGGLVSFEACMDVMDLLYEKEETSLLFSAPHSLAASILVALYVVTVPKQQWEFPVLPWVKFKPQYCTS